MFGRDLELENDPRMHATQDCAIWPDSGKSVANEPKVQTQSTITPVSLLCHRAAGPQCQNTSNTLVHILVCFTQLWQTSPNT